MRLYEKISCIQCSEYEQCPMETRLYVNYCGSMSEKISKQIGKALSQCRARRGLYLKRRRLRRSNERIRSDINL